MIHFSWGDLFLNHQNSHLFAAFIAVFVFLAAIFFGRRALLKSKDDAPAKNLSLRGLFELFIKFQVGLSDLVIGPQGRQMVPVFGAIFLLLWIQNLLGLFPGFAATTGNLNATLAFGVGSFLIYNFYGIKRHGWKYIKQFIGPLMALAPFMLILEIITHLIRPLSLGLRLYGNMMGDHAVLSAFLSMVPVGVPVIFYFLGLFVCTMQAFVFTILSMVYFSMAISDDH